MSPEIQKSLNDVNAVLNDQQRLAATTLEGAVMIIASAGSGKTKTLIHRCASMLITGIAPKNIMMVTFTDKAAREIRDRLEEMPEIGENSQYITAGTFHSIVHKEILLKFPDHPYLKGVGIDMLEATILDDSDSTTLLKEIFKELPEHHAQYAAKNEITLNDIKVEMSLARNKGLDHHGYQYQSSKDNAEYIELVSYVWYHYNAACRRANGIDFDDILLFAYKILKDSPDVSKKLSEVFKYLMLDEYQDTNRVQQMIMDLIAQHHGNICVCGDEKQSIYKFRGSDISIILGFEKKYSNAIKIDINTNYRSYDKVISFANACAYFMGERLTSGQMLVGRQISEDQETLAKRNWNKAAIVQFKDEQEEAEVITSCIERDLFAGVDASEIAILYRNRNQKRILEKQLVRKNISYEIVGDTAFYQRKHIRDCIAMIRFLFHNYDSVAGLRVISNAKLGVSQQNAKKVMQAENISLIQYLTNKSQETLASSSAKNGERLKAHAKKIQPFIELSKKLQECVFYQDDGEYVVDILARIWDLYFVSKSKGQKTDDVSEIKDDIKIVLQNVKSYLNDGYSIDDIIDELIFVSDSTPRYGSNEEPKIKLMTIHASKGLEFDNVYLMGFNDAVYVGEEEEAAEIEESRRLFYVAITRAKKKISITFAEDIMLYGEYKTVPVCRFGREILDRLSLPLLKYKK